MDTFQAIVFSIIHSFTKFLPLGAEVHRTLLVSLFEWPAPGEFFIGLLETGALLALLISFRHDWLSQIAGTLSLVAYRRPPSSLDERLPGLILLSSFLFIGLRLRFQEQIGGFDWPWLALAGGTALLGIPLIWTEGWSRKNKALPNFTIVDTLFVAVGVLFEFLPFGGALLGALLFCFIRNFNREAALRFSYFALLPLTTFEVFRHFNGYSFSTIRSLGLPDGLTTLTALMTVAVSCLSGILVIYSFSKASNVGLMHDPGSKSFGRFMSYRLALGLGMVVVFWLRSRS